MNEYEKLRVKAKQIKEGYPKGARLELNSMRYEGLSRILCKRNRNI